MITNTEKKILLNRCDLITTLIYPHHTLQNRIEDLINADNPEDLITKFYNPKTSNKDWSDKALNRFYNRNYKYPRFYLDKILTNDANSHDKLKRDTVIMWLTLYPKTLHRYYDSNNRLKYQIATDYINKATADYIKRMKATANPYKIYTKALKYLPRHNMIKIMNNVNIQAPNIPRLTYYNQLNTNKSLDDFGGCHLGHLKQGFGTKFIYLIEQLLLSTDKLRIAKGYADLAYSPKDRHICKTSSDIFLNKAFYKFKLQSPNIDYDLGSGDPVRIFKELLHKGHIKKYLQEKKQINKEFKEMNMKHR